MQDEVDGLLTVRGVLDEEFRDAVIALLGYGELSALGVALNVPIRVQEGGAGRGPSGGRNLLPVDLIGRVGFGLGLAVNGHPAAGLDITQMEEPEHGIQIRLEDFERLGVRVDLEREPVLLVEEVRLDCAPGLKRANGQFRERILAAGCEAHEDLAALVANRVGARPFQGPVTLLRNQHAQMGRERLLDFPEVVGEPHVEEGFEALDVHLDGGALGSGAEEVDDDGPLWRSPLLHCYLRSHLSALRANFAVVVG